MACILTPCCCYFFLFSLSTQILFSFIECFLQVRLATQITLNSDHLWCALSTMLKFIFVWPQKRNFIVEIVIKFELQSCLALSLRAALCAYPKPAAVAVYPLKMQQNSIVIQIIMPFILILVLLIASASCIFLKKLAN